MFGRRRKQRDQKTLIKEMTRLVGAQHVLYEDADLIGYEYDATIERARPEVVDYLQIKSRWREWLRFVESTTDRSCLEAPGRVYQEELSLLKVE